MMLRSRTLLPIAGLCAAFALTACGGSDEKPDSNGGATTTGGTGGGSATGGSGGDDPGGSGGSTGGSGGSTGGTGGGSGGSGGTGGGTALEDQLEIFSWWTASGEADALSALIDVFNGDHPGISVTNAAATDPDTARSRLASRMDRNEPPDTFQAISGKDLESYIDSGKLEPLDGLESQLALSKAFPDEVIATVSRQGKPYAVPLNVERDNQLYFNTAVLSANGITAPTSLSDFYSACAVLQANKVTPLSLPPAGWMMALTVFENLMPGVNGGAFYTKFFSGKADLSAASDDRAQLEKLFLEFNKVLGCSDIATASRDVWIDAFDKLADGKAAMAVSGDWATGYLEQKGKIAGTDFSLAPAFGSKGHFVFNSAVFPLPKNAAHPNAAAAFLGTIASAAGQVAFNAKKHSVPARVSMSIDGSDAVTKAEALDYAFAAAGSNTLLPGYATMASPEFQNAVNTSLLVFAVGGAKAKSLTTNVPPGEDTISQGDVDYIVAKIAASYSTL